MSVDLDPGRLRETLGDPALSWFVAAWNGDSRGSAAVSVDPSRLCASLRDPALSWFVERVRRRRLEEGDVPAEGVRR